MRVRRKKRGRRGFPQKKYGILQNGSLSISIDHLRQIISNVPFHQIISRIDRLHKIIASVPPGQIISQIRLRRIVAQVQPRHILWVVTAILIFLTTFAAFKLKGVYAHYASIVDRQLNQELSRGPAGVFAAPRRLSVEQPITLAALRERLLRAGYRQARRSRQSDRLSSGVYVINGDTVEIRTNESARVEGLPKILNIKFSKSAKNDERIISIGDAAAGRQLRSVFLPPELITVDGLTGLHPRTPASFDDFPPDLINAVIAIEDRSFFSHQGVDLKAVIRAMWENWRHGEIREGGSTITQQWIKTSFLTPERTYERKFTEAMMAVAIERRLSKEEIFTIYANRVYLGQSGLTPVYGFKQCARVFFGKDLSELSLTESALIAGLVQAPNRYSPYLRPDAATARRNTVLDAMVETDKISSEEAEAAKSEKLAVIPPAEPDESAAQHFVDYIKRELASRSISEKDQANLRIQTTLDPDLQQAANRAAKDYLEKLDRVVKRRAGAAGTAGNPKETGLADVALLAIDPRTGEILAMVGGRDYAASQLNRVTDARRQPGSVFKPIVYAAALANGISPKSVFNDRPHEFIFGRELYRPQNYGGEFSNQPVTLREGIVRSLNVVAVDAAVRVGLPKVADIAQKMGLPRPEPYPSMALGAFEATPIEIAEAYSTFANGGTRVTPFGVRYITNGKVVESQNIGMKTKVLTPSTAHLITETLSEVVDRGTAARVRGLGYRGPAAGKTGSSRDAWFAGYTPNLLVVVWVGFDDHRDLMMTGSEAAVPIWTDFINRALRARPDLKAEKFNRPSGLELVEIDPQTGMLAHENCPTRKKVMIEISKAPPYCSRHQAKPPESKGRPMLADSPERRSVKRAKPSPDSNSIRDKFPQPFSDGDELLRELQPAIIRRQIEPLRNGGASPIASPTPPATTTRKPEIENIAPPRPNQ